VIVTKELAEDDLQVPDTEDEAVVEQLAPHCTDPALGEGVRSRSPERKPDDPHGVVPEDLVEGSCRGAKVNLHGLVGLLPGYGRPALHPINSEDGRGWFGFLLVLGSSAHSLK